MANKSKPKRPANRPTVLTPQVQSKICKVLRAGNFRDVAATAAGIGVRTFKRWMADGKRATSGIYRDFWHAVHEAEASAESGCVAKVMKAASKDAKHAEWWMERKLSSKWGGQRHEINLLKKQLAEVTKQLEALNHAHHTGTSPQIVPSTEEISPPSEPSVGGEADLGTI